MTEIACTACEGRGTTRHYLNIAGEHYVYHCRECQGTGRVICEPRYDPDTEPRPPVEAKPKTTRRWFGLLPGSPLKAEQFYQDEVKPNG